MGRHTPRTAADDIAEACAALEAAFREMENWRAHLATMATHPEDREAVAHQARRSARIVSAEIARAAWKTREVRARDQLTSVS